MFTLPTRFSALLVPPKTTDSPDQQFQAARTLLNQLLDVPAIQQLIDLERRSNTRVVYTDAVTIWLMILQRLRGGASLRQVVAEAVEHREQLFPDNKRVREGTLSESKSAFAAARDRVTFEAIERFCRLVCDHLANTAERPFDHRRVFLIDGTTITLPPTFALQKAFPPATNQHGTSVWPVAMILVATELQSSCIAAHQIDPMYGPANSSEAKQFKALVPKLPANSIVMADSYYGIFSVAYHSTLSGHDFLFRMTASRFKSLRRRAEPIASGKGFCSYRVQWSPSAKDRKTNPELPTDAIVQVVIHEVTLPNGNPLYLVTSMDFDAISLAELYRRRYDIEFDIRDVKVTMDTENLRGKSVLMVKKELAASVIAYNLVVQFRRDAAKLARVEPRRLSFTGVWVQFQTKLLGKSFDDYESWLSSYTRALIAASKEKHCNRSKPRKVARVAHSRRSKSVHFQAKEPPETSPPPPE